MTTATGTDAMTGTDDYTEPRCSVCGGPVLQYAGSVHGWTCRACLRDYLDEADARWQAKSDKAKDRVSRNHRNTLHHNENQTSVTAEADRRRGGGELSYVPAAAPASPVGDQPDQPDQHDQPDQQRGTRP